VRLVENARLQIPAFGAIQHIPALLDRRTAAWLAAPLQIIARRFSIDEWQSIDHRYQWEIIVNTSLKMPGKLFATGALSLIVGALCVACGGGGSDGPTFPVVMVPPPAATAPAAEPTATPPAAPPEAIAAVPPTAPVAPPPVTPPVAPSTAPPTTPPVASPVAPTAPVAPAVSTTPTTPATPVVARPTPPATSSSTDLPQNAFQQEALDAHNYAREAETGNLSSLKWSAALTADAQAWADQCKFSHSVPEGQGQNLYMTSAPTASAGDAVTDWVGEGMHFITVMDSPKSPQRSYCATGHECGHYTQVVWHSTTDVGCAVKTCSSGITGQDGTDLGTGTILVCNYSPPGNIVGQSPFPPKK
jgi:pathogenesis-related protein 1